MVIFLLRRFLADIEIVVIFFGFVVMGCLLSSPLLVLDHNLCIVDDFIEFVAAVVHIDGFIDN